MLGQLTLLEVPSTITKRVAELAAIETRDTGQTIHQTGRQLDAYAGGGAGTAADVLRQSGLPRQWVTQELAELLDWLRTWNATPANTRIRIVGADARDALRDTQAALATLSSLEPEAAGALQEIWKDVLSEGALRRPFVDVAREWKRPQWETLYVAAQVLDDLLARPTVRLSQSPDYMHARHSARAARLAMTVFEPNPDNGAGGAWDQSDVALATQLLAIVAAPARVVLWGHDAQLVRTGVAPGEAANAGDVLADRLGSAYQVVGFVWRQAVLKTTWNRASTRFSRHRRTTISTSPARVSSSTAAPSRPCVSRRSSRDLATRSPRISSQPSQGGSNGLCSVSRFSVASASNPSMPDSRWNTTPAAQACGEQATG